MKLYELFKVLTPFTKIELWNISNKCIIPNDFKYNIECSLNKKGFSAEYDILNKKIIRAQVREESEVLEILVD